MLHGFGLSDVFSFLRRTQPYGPDNHPPIVESGYKLGPVEIAHFFTCPYCLGRIEMDSEAMMAAALEAQMHIKPKKTLNEILAENVVNMLNALDKRNELMVAREDSDGGVSVIEGETISIRFSLTENKWSVGPGRFSSSGESD